MNGNNVVPKRIDFLDYEDWIGIYIDGELYAEGHSLSRYDWMDILLNVEGPFYQGDDIDIYDDKTIEEFGFRCPYTFAQAREAYDRLQEEES